MLSAGKNVQTLGETMVSIPVEHLYNSLLHPATEVLQRVAQLRIMRQVDPAQYAKNKKLLPYFVCGVFNPPIRKTENFAYTSYFVVDLDKLSERQLDIETLRGRLELDDRVLLSFVSPSEDGLKLLFRLKERCHDAGLYKVFYREFVRRFSEQYHLEQVLDACTCDVCRACFVSIDEHAYYNPQAVPIDINEYLKTDDPTSLFDLKYKQEKELSGTLAETKTEGATSSPSTKEPDSDELGKVKEYLKMKKSAVPAPRHPVFVPERLEEIINELCQFIDDQSIAVYDRQDIQYGKRLRLRHGNKLAEINLFYGKRGFSIVQVTKATLSGELNQIAAELIQLYLDENT